MALWSSCARPSYGVEENKYLADVCATMAQQASTCSTKGLWVSNPWYYKVHNFSNRDSASGTLIRKGFWSPPVVWHALLLSIEHSSAVFVRSLHLFWSWYPEPSFLISFLIAENFRKICSKSLITSSKSEEGKPNNRGIWCNRSNNKVDEASISWHAFSALSSWLYTRNSRHLSLTESMARSWNVSQWAQIEFLVYTTLTLRKSSLHHGFRVLSLINPISIAFPH